MSLVAGRGPLSKDPAGWFSSPLPDDVVFDTARADVLAELPASEQAPDCGCEV